MAQTRFRQALLGRGRGRGLARQPLRDDLRNAVAAHRHAVERVSRLHRLLLVRDDDELRGLGVAAQQLDEPADVRVVERGLDLVQEIERARAREEQREQERDRSERLLAAGEEREPRHALARGTELDLDTLLAGLLVRLGQAEAAVAAREERLRDLGEVLAHRGEGLVEAALDRVVELGAELLELLQARLEVGALRNELGEPLLLPLVLLLRERVDLAERLPAPLEPLDARRELLAVVSFGRLGARVLEPPSRLRGLRFEPRALDVDPGRALARLRGGAARLDFFSAEPPQLGRKLSGTRRAGADPRPPRRLEAGGGPDRLSPRCREPVGELRQRLGAHGLDFGRKPLRPLLELLGLAYERAAAGVELQQHGLHGLACEPELTLVGVVAVALAGHHDAALCAAEIARLGEPDVGKQLGHTLAARLGPDTAGERLRAEKRRPAAALHRPPPGPEAPEIPEAALARTVNQAARPRR